MGVRFLALGRLLRLSLAPSALADVAAGIVFAAGAWPQGAAPWLLLGAGSAVYHGGMALNDWADREHDARTRPERPIPSGRVPAPFALALAVTLLAAGPALAFGVDRGVGLLVLAVALAASAYDLAGRGAVRGPLLLGLCRAGNLGTGLLYGRLASGAEPSLALLAAPAVYGGYVFVVSRLGRLEDAEDGRPLERRPRTLLVLAALLLAGVACVPPPSIADTSARLPAVAGALLLAGAGAGGLLVPAMRTAAWTRPAVLACMGLALRRLLVFTAALALLRGTLDGLLAAGLILLGYPLSWALRRVFPPS